MPSNAPPTIFSQRRRLALRLRRAGLQQRPGAGRWLIDDMVEDVLERLAFLRHEPMRALIVGDWTGQLAQRLAGASCEVLSADPAPAQAELPVDEERPLPFFEFDFIAALNTLDTVNDLPGALIHLRQALAPGGLMIASFPGAGSLPLLRAAMLAADGERPAARIHPMVDARAGGQLLQRAGFADPVADSRALRVRYGSLDALLADLRAQGLGTALASRAPYPGRGALECARAAFDAHEDAEGRVTETFEVLTLSGWKTG